MIRKAWAWRPSWKSSARKKGSRYCIDRSGRYEVIMKTTWLSFLVLLSTFSLANAQGNLSANNKFSVNATTGCAPFTLEVSDEDDSPGSVQYFYNLDTLYNSITAINDDFTLITDTTIYPDVVQSSDSVFTFQEAGNYTVIQLRGGSGTLDDKLDFIQISVVESVTPQVETFACINNSVQLRANGNDPYVRYQVDFGDGTPLDTFNTQVEHQYSDSGVESITVKGLIDGNSFSCADTIITFQATEQLQAPVLDSVQVIDANTVSIYHSNLPSVYTYQIEKINLTQNENSFRAVQLVEKNSDQTQISLTEDLSSNEICFRLVTYNACNTDINLTSARGCAIWLEGSAAPNLENRLTWIGSAGTNQLFRDDSLLITTTDRVYTDHQDLQCTQRYSYRVKRTANGVVSRSNLLELTARDEEQLPELPAPDLQLNGTDVTIILDEAGVPDPQYFILRAESGNPSDTLARNTERAFTDTGVSLGKEYCYTAGYTDACANESDAANESCILIPASGELIFPNAFTPDNDGLNDRFGPRGRLVESINWQVYNRWGEQLYESKALTKTWDGTYNNNPAPEDVYIYKAVYTDVNGRKKEVSGRIFLIRR